MSTLNFSYLVLQFVLLIVFYILIVLDVNDDVFQIYLSLCFAQALSLGLVSKKNLLLLLFLLMTLIFNLAIPVLNLIGLYEFPQDNLILLGDGITTPLRQDSLRFTYQASAVALMGSVAGWLAGGVLKKRGDTGHHLGLQKNVNNSALVSMAFLICFGLSLSNSGLLAYYATEYGYVSVMHARNSPANIPIISAVGDLFYKLLSIAYLYTSGTERKFKARSIIVLIPFFLQAIAGARGEFIVIMMSIAVLYHYSFRPLNVGKIAIYLVAIFLIASFWGTYRFTRDLSDFKDPANILKIMLFHFLGNSASIGVIGYTYQLEDQFTNKVPFLFGYVQGIFSFAKNYTIEGINYKSYLAQHLTYELNPDKLFRGSTIGTAYIAEIIATTRDNFISLFVISGVFMFFARYLTSIYQNSFILYACYFHMIEVTLLAPRGSFMKIFNKETFIYTFILIIIYAIHHFNVHKRNASNE